MAGSLRRLIENVAVLKPRGKTSRALSQAAKAALGMDVPVIEVLDHTLGTPAPAGASPAAVDGAAAKA